MRMTEKKLRKEIVEFIQNGWTDKEIKETWKDYLELDVKPFFPTIFGFIEGRPIMKRKIFSRK